MKTSKQISIVLQKPHPAQAKILAHMKRFNVVSAGRRFGKTAMGNILLAHEGGALSQRPIGWFAPNNKYLLDAWGDAKALFKPIASKISEKDHRITLINGCTIDFWTLDDPDAGRSRKYGRVIIDEATKVKDLEYSWNNAIRPTLADYKGDAWFLSSPKGFDYFRELHLRGQSDDFPDWASWTIPTSANPFIDPQEIVTAKKELPEIVYRQEYLGEFVDSGGTPIRKEYIRYGSPNRRDVVFRVIGVDLASSLKTWADYTAMALLEITRDGKIYITDVRRGRWSFNDVQKRIISMYLEYKPNIVSIESVQAQQSTIQELQRKTRLPIRAFRPSGMGDKLERFYPFVARYEQGLVHHNPNLISEFEDELLSFPVSKLHDDMVDAVSTAFYSLPSIFPTKTAGVGYNDANKEKRTSPMLRKPELKHNAY
jgi:predicted phage terminase large subunit-like protein